MFPSLRESSGGGGGSRNEVRFLWHFSVPLDESGGQYLILGEISSPINKYFVWIFVDKNLKPDIFLTEIGLA